MTIGERIHKLLKEKNLTQKALSEAVGISQSAVSDWKTKSQPQSELLYKISEFLGVSVEYLLTGKENPVNVNHASNIHNSAIVQGNHATTLIVKNGEIQERELSEQELELFRIYKALDVKKQTLLLSYAYKLEEENK